MTDRDDARVANALQGVMFPADRAALLDYAHTREVDPKSMQALRSLPDRHRKAGHDRTELEARPPDAFLNSAAAVTPSRRGRSVCESQEDPESLFVGRMTSHGTFLPFPLRACVNARSAWSLSAAATTPRCTIRSIAASCGSGSPETLRNWLRPRTG